jgi:hypothetical protein
MEYMPSVPDIVVHMPLPSLRAAVTMAPGMGAFTEFLTTPAMAPNVGCTCGGAAGVTVSSAMACRGLLIPVSAVRKQRAGKVSAKRELKYLFIICLTSFQSEPQITAFAFCVERNTNGAGCRRTGLRQPLKAASKMLTVMSSIGTAG